MSNTQLLNVTQNEIGGQNDPLLPFNSMAQGSGYSTGDIPAALIALGCTTIAQGVASGFNNVTGAFTYTCSVAEQPSPGQQPLEVAIPIEVSLQNGNDPSCICSGVIWVCATVQPGDCTGFETGQKLTTWDCTNGFDGCSLAEIVSSGGSSWNAGTATITAVSGGGTNPATGAINWTPTGGITGYTPSASELQSAQDNGLHTVGIAVTVTPASPNEACAGTFLVNVVLSNPCAGVQFFPVNFSS